MVPGTNMTFAGIPRGKERADVITYLNTKSDKPVELPKQAARRAAEKQAAGSAAKPRRRRRPSRTERCTDRDIAQRSSGRRVAAPVELMRDEAAAPVASHRKTDIIG